MDQLHLLFSRKILFIVSIFPYSLLPNTDSLHIYATVPQKRKTDPHPHRNSSLATLLTLWGSHFALPEMKQNWSPSPLIEAVSGSTTFFYTRVSENDDVGWHSISCPVTPAFHFFHLWGESGAPAHWLWETDWLWPLTWFFENWGIGVWVWALLMERYGRTHFDSGWSGRSLDSLAIGSPWGDQVFSCD